MTQLEKNDVPCAGCTLCCQNEALILHPEYGDDPNSYECEQATHPFTGKIVYKLKNAPNGDCIYLDRGTGCTIHERAPAICREFDCRGFYRRFMEYPRAERRRILKRGIITRPLLERGKELSE